MHEPDDDFTLTLRLGARDSRLSLIQSGHAITRMTAALPGLSCELVPMTSPGDQDLQADLRASAPDFFTRFLDDAVRSGELDGALHSAKDLPQPMPAGLDWFWLPWREDARDTVVCRPGVSLADLPAAPVIGVSSDRRESWCRDRWPDATLTSIRGNIDQRLAQLDAGDYDAVIIAQAALVRLELADRATHVIPLAELPPPDGQGYLAVTFRSGDRRMQTLRRLFVKTVDFIGGGPGDAALVTDAGRRILETCDVCLYDALVSPDLLRHLKPGAEAIFVGKRRKVYAMTREEMEDLILEHARRGRHVVHLKGGDPSIFGRLAEELDSLHDHGLPYRVIPGVSSLVAATSGTGLLLTRRGVNHGFSALTCRLSEGEGVAPIQPEVRREMPLVFFMGVFKVAEICQSLMAEGRSPDELASVVFGASTPEQTVVGGTLATLPAALAEAPRHLPGLLLVGPTADTALLYRHDGALAGRRVLLTCSADVMPSARRMVLELGGVPVESPLITLAPAESALPALQALDTVDWLAITSPAAARCLLDLMRRHGIDLRRLPRLLVNGPGTAAVFAAVGIQVDAQPTCGFTTTEMIACAATTLPAGSRVLRLHSDKAGPALAEALRSQGHTVTDCLLYTNVATSADGAPPPGEAVFFASSSAVDAFAANWGIDPLLDRLVVAIGPPTARRLAELGVSPDAVPADSTAEDALRALAAVCVRRQLARL